MPFRSVPKWHSFAAQTIEHRYGQLGKKKPIGSHEPMGVAWALTRLRYSLLAARARASGDQGEFFLKEPHLATYEGEIGLETWCG